MKLPSKKRRRPEDALRGRHKSRVERERARDAKYTLSGLYPPLRGLEKPEDDDYPTQDEA